MKPGLDLVLMWHMHQPDYRRADADRAGEFDQPWTYLHAIKDYTDMAAHLERHPGMRVVVNFVPVLLEQLDDYAAQFASGQFRDPLLIALASEDCAQLSAEMRRRVLDSCFRCHHPTMIEPYPAYARLHRLYKEIGRSDDDAASYLSGAYLSDLLTWYHLVWTGESERRRQPLLARLFAKGAGFSHEDRRELLALIGELITGLVPRYRALAEAGQIELTATPHTHPLAPLLIDFQSARQTLRDSPLPASAQYPGGRTRLQAHLAQGDAIHAQHFGQAPRGRWPAEGAICDTTVRLFAAHGCQWLASSESVLANSLARQGIDYSSRRAELLYRRWGLRDAGSIGMLFRDERLSDLIGFEYSRWHGSVAASHFVAELEAIAAGSPSGQRPLVTVILDGENAWEYYPYNGYYFLDHLYEALAAHPLIRPVTPSALADQGEQANPSSVLDGLVAGSWVYGNLSTWAGHPDKNRAWDLLCEAKRSYDLVIGSGRLEPAARARAERQLAVCEGSDWFWWFGSSNRRAQIEMFDQLYRANLRALYQALELPPPATLEQAIVPPEPDDEAHQHGHSGTMLRGQPQPS